MRESARANTRTVTVLTESGRVRIAEDGAEEVGGPSRRLGGDPPHGAERENRNSSGPHPIVTDSDSALRANNIDLNGARGGGQG